MRGMGIATKKCRKDEGYILENIMLLNIQRRLDLKKETSSSSKRLMRKNEIL